MDISKITRLTNRVSAKTKKNAPQILFAAGIVGSVATVVLASRAGAKSVPVVDQLADDRETLEEIKAEGDLTEELYKAEVRKTYVRAGAELTKLYAPVAFVGIGSVICLTKSHQILSNRNAALAALATSLDKAFKDYRGRVRGEFGEQKDLELLHGTITKEIQKTNAKGDVTSTKEIKVLDPNGATPYSLLFDETMRHWDKDPGYNHTFLHNQEKWANHMLKVQGHLFLNDVLKEIGAPVTPEGQVVGWIYDTTDGDGYISFGFGNHGEFVAGYEPTTWLHFNVDGPILDKL